MSPRPDSIFTERRIERRVYDASVLVTDNGAPVTEVVSPASTFVERGRVASTFAASAFETQVAVGGAAVGVGADPVVLLGERPDTIWSPGR